MAQFQRGRQVALRGAAQVVHDVELRGGDVGGEHRFLRVARLVGVEDGEGGLADGVLLVWGRIRVVGDGVEGGLDDDGDEVAVEGWGGGFMLSVPWYGFAERSINRGAGKRKVS